MTINGNYWWHLAAFFRVAIRQQTRKFIDENGREPNEKEASEIKAYSLSTVRGTVQADQLKEAMGQNTLVFNLDTALRMMGMWRSSTWTMKSETTTSSASADTTLMRQVPIRSPKQR